MRLFFFVRYRGYGRSMCIARRLRADGAHLGQEVYA